MGKKKIGFDITDEQEAEVKEEDKRPPSSETITDELYNILSHLLASGRGIKEVSVKMDFKGNKSFNLKHF
ncbi:MAG: hypothetical protein ABF633_03395 [Clostridium sp.]|uniref:hypothetical protein n=1 Tax=Clostridium sp. TaxID=1506 RepID=UPI0039ED37D2